MNNEDKIIEMLQLVQKDISGIKLDVTNIKDELIEVKLDVANIKDELNEVKHDVTKVQMHLENITEYSIRQRNYNSM